MYLYLQDDARGANDDDNDDDDGDDDYGHLQDDARGADHHRHCEDPQEQPVQHHRHVLPVLFSLSRKKTMRSFGQNRKHQNVSYQSSFSASLVLGGLCS